MMGRRKRTVRIEPGLIERVGNSVVFTEYRGDIELRVVVVLEADKAWTAQCAAEQFRKHIAVVVERIAANWREAKSALDSLTGGAS